MMTSDIFRKVEVIFQAACALPADQRAEYVNEACGEDEILRQRVQRLLKHHERPTVQLDATTGAAVRAISQDLLRRGDLPVPVRIGAYRILRQIGEGGFGVVYLAEQERPRRTVALKIVRWTTASPESIRRFEHETQVLGQLQHPGIAQIFEAGVADVEFATAPSANTPAVPMHYYTMEHVSGPNLLNYAEQPGPGRGPLDVFERLELVARVCDALQHAHQNGVIHRDLKPDNILVVDTTNAPSMSSPTGTRSFGAQPKLLDFGIARVLDPSATATLMRTGAGQLVGTPAYMSPEQVRGDPNRVDTRCDVYAVGVLLYQLLAGRLPYDFDQRGVGDIIRMIEHEEPVPLRSAMASRNFRLNPDIDAIVSAALSKDRERRYQSAAALASDIRRFLANEPIEAKRDSALYLFRKNAQRYRGALLGIAAFVVLVTSFAIWAAYQASANHRLAQAAVQSEARALSERDRATKAAERLAHEVAVSNMDRGRALAAAGNFTDGERLVWRELLNAPETAAPYWALRELYSRYPNRATIRTDLKIIRNLSLSPDERLIAVVGETNTCEVWDVAARQRLFVLQGDAAELRYVRFTPDGAQIATGAVDGSVRFWNTADGGCRQQIRAETYDLNSMCFSADGRFLLTAGDEGTLHVWRVDDGVCCGSLGPRNYGITVIDVSPDNALVAVGDKAGTLALYAGDELFRDPTQPLTTQPVNPTEVQLIARFQAQKDNVLTMAFSRDGRLIATSGYNFDRTVRVWDARTFRCLATLPNSVGVMDCIAFSPDGKRLYAGGWFTIDVWDLDHGQRRPSAMKGKCAALAASKREGVVFSGSDATLRIWSDSDNPGLLDLGENSGRTMAFSPDGNYLVTAIGDGSIELRNPGNGVVLRRLSPPQATRVPTDRLIRVRPLAIHPAGAEIATVSWNGWLWRWNPTSGDLIESRPAAEYFAQQSLAYRPDGKQFANGVQNVTFLLRDLAGLKPPQVLPAGRTQALSIAYSPDNQLIATTSREGAVRLSTADGKLLARMECGTVPWGVVFSPDSRRIYVSTWLFTIQEWDVQTYQLLRSFEGHSATVWGVRFKPDDPSILASCSADGTVRLWDISDGRTVATFDICTPEEAMVLDLSPDGRRLGVSSSRNAIRILDFADLDRCIRDNLDAQLERHHAESRDPIDAPHIRAVIGEHLLH